MIVVRMRRNIFKKYFTNKKRTKIWCGFNFCCNWFRMRREKSDDRLRLLSSSFSFSVKCDESEASVFEKIGFLLSFNPKFALVSGWRTHRQEIICTKYWWIVTTFSTVKEKAFVCTKMPSLCSCGRDCAQLLRSLPPRLLNCGFEYDMVWKWFTVTILLFVSWCCGASKEASWEYRFSWKLDFWKWRIRFEPVLGNTRIFNTDCELRVFVLLLL